MLYTALFLLASSIATKVSANGIPPDAALNAETVEEFSKHLNHKNHPDFHLEISRHILADAFEGKPGFYHGVASEDPLPDKVIVWTRYTPEHEDDSIPLELRMAEVDPSLDFDAHLDPDRNHDLNMTKVLVDASSDFVAKLDVTGLKSNTHYVYAFVAIDDDGNTVVSSQVGQTRTAPAFDDDVEELTYAFFSCSHFSNGYFHPYDVASCISTSDRHSRNTHDRRDWNTLSNTFPDELLQEGGEVGSSSDTTGTTIHDNVKAKGKGVYSLNDFRNDIGITVPYWKDLLASYNLPYNEFDDFEEYYDGSFNDEAYGVQVRTNVNSSSVSSSSSLRTNNNNTNTTIGNDDSVDVDIDVDVDTNEDFHTIIPHLGPCYLPQTIQEMNDIPWSELIEKNYNKSNSEQNISYPAPYVSYKTHLKKQQQKHPNPNQRSHHSSLTSPTSIFQKSSDLANYCRPGFIIIGAGKCGTSSLYHYLTGHNRVAPAKKKQIHYFKYYPKRPMSWYLSHFYSTRDFLSSGSLITGEASPGYLPYPDVAHRIRSYMEKKANNGSGQTILSTPKIITIVRNPLERSYSSYNYNYVEPGLLKIKNDVKRARRQHYHRMGSSVSVKCKNCNSNGSNSTITNNRSIRSKSGYLHNHSGIAKKKSKKSKMVDNILSKNMTDEEIVDEYLFSFEQLVEAEMTVLKECLKKGGAGEEGAKKLYGTKPWAMPLFDRREQQQQQQEQEQSKGSHYHDLPPLVTMDYSCYGDSVSSTIPRVQWKQLIESHPQKIINVKKLHLVQSIVGRSLYSLPLEWWYSLYPSDDLYLVCNEDLKYRPGKTMSDVSDFLGLPTFNFDSIVSKGMYNVGGNEGYDRVTDWQGTKGTVTTKHEKNDDGIPISDELRSKYLSFVKPYNERLFVLADKRCNW